MTNRIDDDFIPPQSEDAEMAVIGSILQDPKAFIVSDVLLKASSFYKTKHRIIYKKISDMIDSEQSVDLITLTDELRKDNKLEEIGGVSYLVELQEFVPSASNVKQYASIVVEKYKLRQILEMAYEIKKDIFENKKAINILGYTSDKMIDITMQSEDHEPTVDVLQRVLDNIELKRSGEEAGIQIPIDGADEKIGRLTNGDLVLFAAKPGTGKTTAALQIATDLVYRKNKKVGIFSLEMSSDKLLPRIMSQLSEVEFWRIEHDNLTLEQSKRFTKATGLIADRSSNIIMHDSIYSIHDIKARAMQMKQKDNIDLLILDYIQLVVSDGENENIRLQNISKNLKMMARKMNIPIIAISQLNRINDGQEPSLINLRGSGGLEQDADRIIFLHRPDPQDGDEIVYFLSKKNRNGKTGRLENVMFYKGLSLFKKAEGWN